MDELERRIRDAKPGHSTRHLPLTERAEADLIRIKQGTLPALAHAPRSRAPLFATVAVATLAIVALIIFAVSSVPTIAFAATPPLLQTRSVTLDPKETLETMSELVAQRTPTPGTNDTQTIRVQSWVLSVTDDGKARPSTIVPEDMVITRAQDGSRDISVSAGRAADANGAPATGRDIPDPGTALWSEHYAAGEYSYLFPTPPPTTREEMRLYLAAYGGLAETATVNDYLNAITQLLMEWDLAPAQESAVLQTLAALPDLELAGSVTDRLGRPGTAFRSSTDSDYRALLVVSATTGQILSTETIYTGKDRTDIPSPAVIAYYAWNRNQP